MRRIQAVVALLIAGLAVGGLAMTVGGGPADCSVVEGAGIGRVRIGMSVAAALSLTGPPQGQQTVGSQVIYALRPPWWWILADHGIVERISTRAPECRTPRGARVGSTLAAVRDAYASTLPHVSIITPADNGDLLSYPLLGIAFRVRRDQVEAIEVFRAERLVSAPAAAATPVQGTAASPGGATPAGATPTATTAAGSWAVRSTTARVDEGALTVTGTIENRAAPRAVYVEVRALNPAGRQIGQSDAPVFPNPVPNGGSATFEVRVPIDDIARRYQVIIRPIGTLTGSLAEAMGEVKDLQQFATVVARQIQVQTQTTANPPTRDDFVVVVTNASPLTVASVGVSIEITATCRIPFPTPRTIQEIRSGSVVVSQLRPGASARATLPVSPGACIEFATWSATHRIGEVRIAE
ncbi:MAG: FxLYD domain-containing protein [Armatimonadota bacterium]